MEKICQNCNKTFNIKPYLVKKGYGKYCSNKCYQESRWAGDHQCKQCGKFTKTRFCSPECQRDYWNKREYLRAESRKEKFWNEKKELINLLGGKCSRCGNDDIRVLDINHKDPTVKDRNGGNYNGYYRLRDWRKNIDSIELLCANCHRIYTWEQQFYGLVNGKSI